jgi:hypothetical protein
MPGAYHLHGRAVPCHARDGISAIAIMPEISGFGSAAGRPEIGPMDRPER